MNKLLILSILFHWSCFTQVENLQSIFGDQFIVQQTDAGYEITKKKYVSVSDFLIYQQDVRDSVALEKLYYNIEEDSEVLIFLDLNRHQKKTIKNLYDRGITKENFNLNRRNKKLNTTLYTATYHIPLLADIRVPEWKRYLFDLPYTFDDRNVFYRFPDTDETSSLLLNHWVIAKNSQHPNDVLNIIAKRHLVFEKDNPIIGMSQQQIEGYLNWQKHKLESLFKDNGVLSKFSIVQFEEATKLDFLIEKEQLREQWEITNEDYKSFLAYTEDSLLREYLFYNIENDFEASKYLAHDDEFFHYLYYEYIVFDHPDRVNNRKIFNLAYSAKIKQNNDELKSLLERFYKEVYGNKIPYSYVELDARKQINKFESTNYSSEIRYSRTCDLYTLDTVNIDLPTFKPDKNDMVSKLSYKQALAFYHWKYPINKATKEDGWEKYVFPSEEEFQLLKKGELRDINASLPINIFSYKVILKK